MRLFAEEAPGQNKSKPRDPVLLLQNSFIIVKTKQSIYYKPSGIKYLGIRTF